MSLDAFTRSLADRVRLNQQILENAYWCLPVIDKSHPNFVPVGRGERSSPSCGQWQNFLVCDNVEGHKGLVLKGVDYTGKLAVTHQHLWCHRATCPVCFIRGWSVREARSIETRLVVGSERGLGDAEHVTVSVPLCERDFLEEVLRERSRLALWVRGVLGGCMIFHGYRKDRCRNGLVWSPHYHVLGFIRGGFDVCRDCIHSRDDCASCEGFKGREVREFANDGYLVKVHDVRKTVLGTAWYNLHHATVRVGVKRFHVVTWFGSCGNRKFKSRKVTAVAVCPVCSSEMVKKIYRGSAFIARSLGDPRYMKVFPFEEFDASGLPNFVDVVGGASG